jgi:hypothetical protein
MPLLGQRVDPARGRLELRLAAARLLERRLLAGMDRPEALVLALEIPGLVAEPDQHGEHEKRHRGPRARRQHRPRRGRLGFEE